MTFNDAVFEWLNIENLVAILDGLSQNLEIRVAFEVMRVNCRRLERIPGLKMDTSSRE